MSEQITRLEEKVAELEIRISELLESQQLFANLMNEFVNKCSDNFISIQQRLDAPLAN